MVTQGAIYVCRKRMDVRLKFVLLRGLFVITDQFAKLLNLRIHWLIVLV